MEHDELLEEVRSALGTGTLASLQWGGQKQVFRSELEDVPVAVKVVLVPEASTYAAEAIERARREVELLATVESPFVVRVLSEAIEIGERPEAVCWVEELLDGSDLRHIASSFPWEAEEVWTLISDTASGLQACHELDVVHRDLSPGNVRRRASGRFVLMDPGFARHLSKEALTGVYQPGTRNYSSPEHVPGGSPTPASDVFGLGILAFEALTGSVPISYAGDDAAYYELLRTGQAAGVKTIRPDVPDELAAVVDQCLQRQPARRYLDATELLADVEALSGAVGDPSPTAPTAGGE